MAPASSVPAPLTGASSLPAAPGGSAANPAYSAATVASGPQPASAYPAQPPVMLPPMHYQGQPPAGGYGYPPGQGSPAPPMQAGHVRSADEMDGGADAAPPAKRQRVAKLPGGQLYPEADWIAMHPVSEDSIREMIVLIGAPSTRSRSKYSSPRTIRNRSGSWTGRRSRCRSCRSTSLCRRCGTAFCRRRGARRPCRASGCRTRARC